MTETDKQAVVQAQRDITTARADLVGRRDQVVADYDERLSLLGRLAADLESGNLSPKTAQTRVRQVLGERSGVAGRARVGRGHMGLGAPIPTPSPATPTPVGKVPTASPVLAHAALTRALQAVDGRIVKVLTLGDEAEASVRSSLRLELALLCGLRRALATYPAEELPSDVVLLEGLMEFSSEVEATLNDLESGGTARLSRLLDYDRLLVSQVVATGQTGLDVLKQQIKTTKASLETQNPSPDVAVHAAVSAFQKLQTLLDKNLPGGAALSILDEILQASQA